MENIDCNRSNFSCYEIRIAGKSQIEVFRTVKGEIKELNPDCNNFVFLLEGMLQCAFSDFSDLVIEKGQMIFLAAGEHCVYNFPKDSTIMVFKIYDSLELFENLSIEDIYEVENESLIMSYSSNNISGNILHIHPAIWGMLENIHLFSMDGVNSENYYKLKFKEFFILLQFYYSKEEIHDFLYHALSKDMVFSDYIRLHWHEYPTIRELAESLHLTTKQLTKKFKYVFGKTPYRWILEQKSNIIFRELSSNRKTFKQIGIEQGFSTMAQFTKFCKKELGNTPTELRGKKIQEKV